MYMMLIRSFDIWDNFDKQICGMIPINGFGIFVKLHIMTNHSLAFMLLTFKISLFWKFHACFWENHDFTHFWARVPHSSYSSRISFISFIVVIFSSLKLSRLQRVSGNDRSLSAQIEWSPGDFKHLRVQLHFFSWISQ